MSESPAGSSGNAAAVAIHDADDVAIQCTCQGCYATVRRRHPSTEALCAFAATPIVLAAADPGALAAFYAALLEDEATPGLSLSHWQVTWPLPDSGGALRWPAPH